MADDNTPTETTKKKRGPVADDSGGDTMQEMITTIEFPDQRGERRSGSTMVSMHLFDLEGKSLKDPDKELVMVHQSKELALRAQEAAENPKYRYRMFLRGFIHVWPEIKTGANGDLGFEAKADWVAKTSFFFAYPVDKAPVDQLHLANARGVLKLELLDVPETWRIGDKPPILSDGKILTENQLHGFFTPCTQLVVFQKSKKRNLYAPSLFGSSAFGLIQSTQQFYDTARPHVIYDKSTFKLMCCAGLLSDRYKFNPVELWSASKFPKTVHAASFRPGANEIFTNKEGQKIINVFRPSDVRSNDVDVAPFLEFLDRWRMDESSRNRLLYWMANVVRYNRIRYAAMIISPQEGVGKDTLGEFMMHLVGEHNSVLISEIDIDNGNLMSTAYKAFGVVSEVYQGNNPRFTNNLKSLITNDRVKLSEKYEKSQEVDNHLALMLFSNDLRGANMQKTGRRYDVYILRNCDIPTDTSYWTDLRRWFFREGGDGAVMRYLSSLDFSEVRFRDLNTETPPDSEDKRRLIADQMPEWSSVLEEELGPEIEAVIFNDVHLSVGSESVTLGALRKALGELGFTRAHGSERLQIKRNNKVVKLTVWSRGKTLTGSSIGEMIEEGRLAVFADSTRAMLAEHGLKLPTTPVDGAPEDESNDVSNDKVVNLHRKSEPDSP